MKILFIYTDVGASVGYSAGIGALSAVLREKGNSTRLIHVSEDLGYPLDEKKICKDIAEYAPGLICFSVTTSQWYFAKQIGRAAKAQFPVPIMVGGHHPTCTPYTVIREDWVDMICRGEGDLVLPEIVSRLEAGKNLSGIPNIFYKQDGKIKESPMTSWVQDINILPFEDREIFDYSRIIDTRSGWAEVIVTRGCPFHCTYCFNKPLLDQYKSACSTDSANGENIFSSRQFVSRRRSVNATITYLKCLKDKYTNIRYFTFVDDVMAMEGKWFSEFTQRYKTEIGLPYACTSQPLLFTETLAKQLKESGCKVVKMGVEAGNEEIRKKVLKRRISNDKLREVFKVARNYGLKPQAFNMIGIPGETFEHMMETITFNAELKPYIVWLSTFSPYPGTELYQYCLENDLIDETKWEEVDSYRGGSVLRDEILPDLELKKLRILFRWILNSNLGNDADKIYQDLCQEFRQFPEHEWYDGTAEKKFKSRDAQVDELMRQKDISHYIGKKYINMFWGKEYEYDLS